MAGTSKQTTGRKDDTDYISRLPDFLITHIFSVLPMRDVVKTCVLSKSWGSVWTTISDLRFSVYCYDHSFVDRVLTLYEWATVKKFHLDIRWRLIYPFQIDSWVRFANDDQVEELHLNHDIWPVYTLSPLLCNCSSLTRLRLSGCNFSSSESISWSSLECLSLQNVTLSDEVLQKILLGTPVLEYLNLKRCYGVKGIHSTSLKELVIEDNNGLRFLTPRLLLLRVTGHSYYETIRLVEAPPLLEAELDFYGSHQSDFCLPKEMLCKLENATRILLSSWCAWIMGTRKVEDVQVSLPNCKSLTLHVPIPEFSFHVVANMLATILNLEKLVIIFKPFDPYSVMWPLKVEDMLVLLPNCKSLTLHMLIPDFSFPVIAKMLATTPNLENLVIILKPWNPYSGYSLNSNSQNVYDQYVNESYWHIKKKLKSWVRHVRNVEIFI